MAVTGIDHVRIAIPAGEEDRARAFYGGVLGMVELPKRASLGERGGAWFACGGQQLHLGADGADFQAARKAHPALLVDDLAAAIAACESAGVAVVRDAPIPGYERAFVHDPFGNRIELMQRL